MIRARAIAPLLFAFVAVGAGCEFPRPVRARAPVPEPPRERVQLDPEVSPLPFRWLSEDAVLVDAEAGKRSLADFGNFIGRSARTARFARVSIWDDEEAWRRSRSEEPSEEVLTHKRAEYLKDAEPAPVEEFTVFSPSGEVMYERDFRDYPLTDTDER